MRTIGLPHWDAEADREPLPGPAPEVFFAPDEIVRRGRELGPAVGYVVGL